MSLMTKPREMRGLLRIGSAVICVAVGVATCGSALALRLDVNEPPPAAADHNAKDPVNVASGIMAGSKIGGENPKYPPKARAEHLSGTVVLHAVISKTGDIASLQVLSGPEILRASALEAVRTWRYKPFLLNGEPTAVETTININFNLGG